MFFARLRTLVSVAVALLLLSPPSSADVYQALATKGTMSFVGLKKQDDRANIIAYLNAGSAAPADFADSRTINASSAETEDYEFGILHDAPGVEATYYACTACHSEMIVAQQGLTRAGWEEMFEWMIEEQGMAEIEEPELSEILDYLAEHYNEDRPNFPNLVGN